MADNVDHTHGDTGTKPNQSLNFASGDFPDPETFDWFWSEVPAAINDHATKLEAIDSNGDGVVDQADVADSATTYKGNDIDSDGDGKVDYADNADKLDNQNSTTFDQRYAPVPIVSSLQHKTQFVDFNSTEVSTSISSSTFTYIDTGIDLTIDVTNLVSVQFKGKIKVSNADGSDMALEWEADDGSIRGVGSVEDATSVYSTIADSILVQDATGTKTISVSVRHASADATTVDTKDNGVRRNLQARDIQ